MCYVCTRCGHFIMKFSLNWESFYKQVVWHTWHCILMSLSNAREKNILKCSAIFSNVKMWDPIILVMNLWTILITVEPLKAQVILWLESPPRGLGGDDNLVPRSSQTLAITRFSGDYFVPVYFSWPLKLNRKFWNSKVCFSYKLL